MIQTNKQFLRCGYSNLVQGLGIREKICEKGSNIPFFKIIIYNGISKTFSDGHICSRKPDMEL